MFLKVGRGWRGSQGKHSSYNSSKVLYTLIFSNSSICQLKVNVALKCNLYPFLRVDHCYESYSNH